MSSQRNPAPTHGCGGTITRHGSPDPEAEPRDYLMCERCGAFRYVDGDDGDLPSGEDREANQQAWDDQEDESPARAAGRTRVYCVQTPGAPSAESWDDADTDGRE